MKLEKEAEEKILKDSKGRIIFYCSKCEPKYSQKRKEHHPLGYPSNLCSRHLKNPEALSRRVNLNGKTSLFKESGIKSPIFIVKKPLQTFVIWNTNNCNYDW